MEKISEFFRTFFQIREKLPAAQRVILGMLPILVILFVWFLATLGKNQHLRLPEGLLDTGDVIPVPGRVVDDGVRLKIADARLEFDSVAEENVVIFKGERFPLAGLQADDRDGAVSIKLKYGYFRSREVIGSPTAQVDAPGSLTQAIPSPSPDGGVSQNTFTIGEQSPQPVVTPPAPSSPPVSRGGVVVGAKPPITVWHFVYERIETRFFPAGNLPSPGEVKRSFIPLWTKRELGKNVWISFVRVMKGFLVAFAVAFPLGLMMGAFSKVHAAFNPLMIFSSYTPIAALVPLTMTFFGLTETQKVMFLALAFFIYLLPMIVRAVEEVDNVFLQTAYTLGASKWQAMYHVLLGISWPDIFDAMRMSFGVGWGYIILAEIVGAEGGIGYLISISQRRALTADVYLLLVVIIVIAFVTDKLWEAIGDKIFPYRRLKR